MTSATPETYHLVYNLGYFPYIAWPYDIIFPDKPRSEVALKKLLKYK